MIAVRITNVKNFMGKLLTQDTFERFLLAEASVTTYNTFVIDGHLVREFYSAQEWAGREDASYEFSQWSEMQKLCFDLIKGKNTPVAFRFTLHLKPEYHETVLDISQTDVLPSQVRAFVLNVRFQQGVLADPSGSGGSLQTGTSDEKDTLMLTTGTSFTSFLLDKAPDELWDTYMLKFLDTQDISYEKM